MKICCIPSSKISKEILQTTASFNIDYITQFNNKDVCWIERSEAETNSKYRQLIPYVLLQRADKKFACYPRHGTEKRLHGFYSCGIGGHIDEPDKKATLQETLQSGMFRELAEELSNFDFQKVNFSYLGLINETKSNVGLVHLGVVFLAKCTDNYIPTAANELSGLEWKTLSELKEVNKELWTELAFCLIEKE